MATQTYLKTLVDQVKAEKDPSAGICKLADVVLAMDNENEARYGKIDKKIDKISIAVLGNGEPEKSIAARVDRLERWQKVMLGVGLFISTTSGGWLIVVILERLAN